MERKPTKVFGYVRVSTDIQVKEGHSIEAQKNRIYEYCKYKKYNFDRYFVDEGKSGKDMKREHLIEMIEALEPGIAIVVISLSRLTRSVKDGLELLNIVKNKGSNLVILDLDVDTNTPTGDLMYNIMVSVSQFERKNTAEKVSIVLNDMSSKGTLRTKPRFGYKVIGSKEDKTRELVINEEEQAVIQRIRDIINDNPDITVSNICKILEYENIKIRKCKKIYRQYITNIIKDNSLR